MLYTCLFASAGHDLRALLRGGKSDDEIAASSLRRVAARDDRYSETAHEADLARSEGGDVAHRRIARADLKIGPYIYIVRRCDLI